MLLLNIRRGMGTLRAFPCAKVAISEDCNNVLKILGEYESWSRQKINKDKTTIFFSKSTTDEAKSSIKNLFQVQEVKLYEKYLGLPSFVGKGKKASFNYIKERVW